MTFTDFETNFFDALMSVIIRETGIGCVVVNNIIKFAASGMSLIKNYETKDGKSGVHVITAFLRLFRKFGQISNTIVRWRFCLLFNHLLSYMSEGTVLSEELCDVASILLLQRLKDKKSEIRVQAVYALHRLQVPENPKCKIVEEFLFHLCYDPSFEVRTAVVKKIALLYNVVEEMLKNTLNDVNDSVRKETYNRLLSYPFHSFSSSQRMTILERGLNDTNASIKSILKKRLLKSWFEMCNDDFIVFLQHLEVDNELLCEKVLNIMFEFYYDCLILDLTKEFLNSNSRMIDFDQLTAEKIFLWKCVAKYLTKEKKIELARTRKQDDDYIEILLPDLVIFSDYIREYFFTYNSESNKEFMLIHLLDMATIFEIDDFGAETLNKLCFDIILDCHSSVKPIKYIGKLLNLTFKNGRDILNYVKKLLNEIQAQIIDVDILIDKLGNKELLEYKINLMSKEIEELLETKDSSDLIRINVLNHKKEIIENQCKEIILLPEQLISVENAIKSLLKGFELVFVIQQYSYVCHEPSLMTDIIQNVIVGYVNCSKADLRMEAIRCLAPYLLTNNVAAAKEHMTTLCAEIANPLSDRHLMFEILFELFIRYDVKTFDLNDDLDVEVEHEDVFSVDSILSLLADCIDYEIDDSSIKLIVLEGLCDLLVFEKIKSINLLTKLLIIWFRHSTQNIYNVQTSLTKFFSTYVFYINSSSNTLAKCYVPVLEEIKEYNLTTKLNIRLDEMNSTLINLIGGLMFCDTNTAINAHGELAGYIFDYLLVEDQTYTSMLVDTLCKLTIYFDNDIDLINVLGPKLLRVIKHFKTITDKNSLKYLKKIKNKFDPVLQKKALFTKQKDKKKIEIVEVEDDSQGSSHSNQEPICIGQTKGDQLQEPQQKLDGYNDLSPKHDVQVEVHSDLFSQEHILNMSSSDDEDNFINPQLDALKRMSEMFKKSFSLANNESIVLDSDCDSD